MLIRIDDKTNKVFFSDFYQGDKEMTKEEIKALINKLYQIWDGEKK